jgi:hypothetical protein
MTCEDWLIELTNALRPVFQEIGHPLPDKLRVSCGWPSSGGLNKKRRALGECWYSGAARTGVLKSS